MIHHSSIAVGISVLTMALVSAPSAPSMPRTEQVSPSSGIVILTSENIKEVLVSSENKTLVLNFWAPWCPPCKAMTPVLIKMAEENPEVIFGRVDIQTQNEMASEYGIASIPITYIMRNQKIIKKLSGFASEEDLKIAINSK